MPRQNNKGFSIFEVIFFLTTLTALIAFVIIFLKPQEQLARSRNEQRSSDINSILKAVYLYSNDNDSLPATIPSSSDCLTATNARICRTDVPTANCTSLINLSSLTKGSKYLVNIPSDPSNSDSSWTGYNIIKTSNNKITVCAPLSEGGEGIILTE